MTDHSEQPVFILGSASSGTTMLSVMLDRHPDVACGPETYLLNKRQIYTDYADFRAHLAHWLDRGIVSDGQIDTPDFCFNREAYFTDRDQLIGLADECTSLRQFLDRFFAQYLQRRGKRRWAEKSGSNAYYLRHILAMYPQARLVHLVRDGRDVMCSMLRRDPGMHYHAASHWLYNNAAALRWRRHPGYLQVRYEDLATDPRTALAAICNHIHVDYDGAMLEPGGDDYWRQCAASNTHPSWKSTPIGTAVSDASVGRYKTELAPQLASLFWHTCLTPTGKRRLDVGYHGAADLMLALGYADHVPDDLPPVQWRWYGEAIGDYLRRARVHWRQDRRLWRPLTYVNPRMPRRRGVGIATNPAARPTVTVNGLDGATDPLRCLGVLCTNVDDAPARQRARRYFKSVARDYPNLSVFEYDAGPVHVIGYGHERQLAGQTGGGRDIVVTSRWTANAIGASVCRLHITDEHLQVSADWCASVNCLYQAWRGGIIVSTNEPALHACTQPTIDDIDTTSLYNLALTTHHVGPYTLLRDQRFLRGGERMRYVYRSAQLSTDWTVDWESHRRFEGSLDEATDAFHDLNTVLFDEAFADVDEVFLPISSGYDSRLIACYLKRLGKTVHTASYGPADTLDVLAGRQIARKLGMSWQRFDVPDDCLGEPVGKALRLFGPSMHLHPMYQYPFLSHYATQLGGCSATSGFMTGVPAGQHIRKLAIGPDTFDYLAAMLVFDHAWSVRDLRHLFTFDTEAAYRDASQRWRAAFEQHNLADYQRSVLGDCFNRQSRWISYFPRLYAHYFDCVSPSVDIRYVTFLLSLPKEYLTGRSVVERMFVRHFPHVAGVISNSEGLRPPGKSLRSNLASSFWRIRRRLPEYNCTGTRFEAEACKTMGARALWPAVTGNGDGDGASPVLDALVNRHVVQAQIERALQGDDQAYTRLSCLQPVYYTLASHNAERDAAASPPLRIAA